MQMIMRGLLGLSLLGCTLAPAFGALSSSESLLHRDRGYEENLRQEATADNAITPAKVFRWLCALNGHALKSIPSNTEFQPIVNVYEGRVQVIAAINYKF